MHSVLLVDSHKDTREMYIAFLEAQGLRVLGCATTDAAWRAVRRVDLVVVGLNVPGRLDGAGFVKRVRNDAHVCDLPVIVLTASVSPRNRATAAIAGADLFLPKPCAPNQLLQAIEATLASHRAKRRSQALVPAMLS